MQKNNSGRSMVEMLGVLAIIGVLSIGGVIGFRTAMAKHKANVLLNNIMLAYSEVVTYETAPLRRILESIRIETGEQFYYSVDEDYKYIQLITPVDKYVCMQVLELKKEPIKDILGYDEQADCSDANYMKFAFEGGIACPPGHYFDDSCQSCFADGERCPMSGGTTGN